MGTISLRKVMALAILLASAGIARAQSALTMTTWSNIPSFEIDDPNQYVAGSVTSATLAYTAATTPDSVTTLPVNPGYFYAQPLALNSAIKLSGFLNVAATDDYMIYMYDGSRISIDGVVIDSGEAQAGGITAMNAPLHLTAGAHRFEAYGLYVGAYTPDIGDTVDQLSPFGDSELGFSIYNAGTEASIDGFFSPDAASVPEPASWALFIGGFGLVGSAMRRRRADASDPRAFSALGAW